MEIALNVNLAIPKGDLVPLKRALFLTVGSAARTVAETCLALGQDWLQTEPPLEIVDFAAVDADETYLAAAWTRLANAERIEALAERGFPIDRQEEIALWLLLDVSCWQPGGDGAATGCSVEAMLQFVDELDAAAWAQLRVRTVPHVLLLAAPQHQQQALDLLRHLIPLCNERIYLAGPVDHRHLRLDESVWPGRVAAGVAALLWGQEPSHAAPHPQEPDRHWVRALGAAFWTTPRTEIMHWLASTWASRTIDALRHPTLELETTEPQATGQLPLLPASPQRLVESLESRLPRPSAPPPNIDHRPQLVTLHRLPQQLEARLHRLEERTTPERRQQRNLWLDEHLASWIEELDGVQENALAPGLGWPRLQTYRMLLALLQQNLRDCLCRVDETLSVYTERIGNAERTYRQERQKLADLCRDIPELTPLGVLRLAAQPWRWPVWIWRYSQTIPHQMGAMLEALHRHIQLNWEEGNWHCVRQMHLVMAQLVQERLSTLDQLDALFTEMAAELTSQLGAAERLLPAPWTPQRLAWLYDHLLGDGATEAWAFLETLPSLRWLEHPAADMVKRLQTWAASQLEMLAGWSALDFLAASLPATDFDRWMDRLVEEARPLWPAQELSGDLAIETWFYEPPDVHARAQRPGDELAMALTPESQDEEAHILKGQGWSRLQHWRSQRSGLLSVRSAVDGVLVLRWLPVDLAVSG